MAIASPESLSKATATAGADWLGVYVVASVEVSHAEPSQTFNQISLLRVMTPRAMRSLLGSDASVVQRALPAAPPAMATLLSPLQLEPSQVR